MNMRFLVTTGILLLAAMTQGGSSHDVPENSDSSYLEDALLAFEVTRAWALTAQVTNASVDDLALALGPLTSGLICITAIGWTPLESLSQPGEVEAGYRNDVAFARGPVMASAPAGVLGPSGLHYKSLLVEVAVIQGCSAGDDFGQAWLIVNGPRDERDDGPVAEGGGDWIGWLSPVDLGRPI